jgi:nitrogen fixation protein FixH
MSTTAHPRDRWIPWYFVAFFLVVIVVDSILGTLAVRTQTGTVTEHAYEKGLAYNTIIKAEEQQASLGWKSDITLADNILHVTLHDTKGVVLTPQQLTARFFRPTQAGMDFNVNVKNGEAPVTLPAHGLWEVRIYATVNGTSYQQSKRLVIP